MGLSDNSRKTKLVGSASSRNAAWTNDASLPGQRLLSSMGWTQGQGLGSSSQGTAVPITMAFKMDNKGIGARRHEREARASGKADAWIGGGGELGDLFARLNKASESPVASVPQTSDEEEEEEEEREEVSSSSHSEKKRSKEERRSEKEKARAERKSLKEEKKGKRKREQSKAKDKESDLHRSEKGKTKEAEPAQVEEAVQRVASALPHRMASRARFLRAKRMVGTDQASINEILGIASPSASSSPAPAEVAPVEVGGAPETRREEEGVSQDASSSSERKGKRKREEDTSAKSASKEAKRDAKAAKREAKQAKREARGQGKMDGEEVTKKVEQEAASDPSFEAGGGMKVSALSVQEYLQSQLMKRRAAIIRRRREEEAGIWKRAAAVAV